MAIYEAGDIVGFNNQKFEVGEPVLHTPQEVSASIGALLVAQRVTLDADGEPELEYMDKPAKLSIAGKMNADTYLKLLQERTTCQQQREPIPPVIGSLAANCQLFFGINQFGMPTTSLIRFGSPDYALWHAEIAE